MFCPLNISKITELGYDTVDSQWITNWDRVEQVIRGAQILLQMEDVFTEELEGLVSFIKAEF
jgi:hypothetical protein